MIPHKAIDRLFERLNLTYGAQWARMWEGMPLNDVKSMWGYELQGFANRLDAIAWALENLPPKAPNAIEFKHLCRMAPMPPEKQLPAPKADPERMRQELARLGEIRKSSTGGSYDHKAWARAIVARHEAGEKVNPTSLGMARDALRLHLTSEAA